MGKKTRPFFNILLFLLEQAIELGEEGKKTWEKRSIFTSPALHRVCSRATSREGKKGEGIIPSSVWWDEGCGVAL